MLSGLEHSIERSVDCLATTTLPGLLCFLDPKASRNLKPWCGNSILAVSGCFILLYTRVMDCFSLIACHFVAPGRDSCCKQPVKIYDRLEYAAGCGFELYLCLGPYAFRDICPEWSITAL